MTASTPYPFDPAIVDRGHGPPTPKERSARMKAPLALDRDDRHALATLGSYVLSAVLVSVCVVVTLLSLTCLLALCVRLFEVIA